MSILKNVPTRFPTVSYCLERISGNAIDIKNVSFAYYKDLKAMSLLITIVVYFYLVRRED